MDGSKKINCRKYFLALDIVPVFRKFARSKVIFVVGIFLFLSSLLFSVFYMISEDKKSVNKILLARESTLNATLTKHENKRDILEAEVLLLQEELNSLIKQNEQKKIKKIEKYLTNTAVKGAGVQIILSDSVSDFISSQDESSIIHNTDLLKIVNFLWEQGAHAISINNQRIAQDTSINCAGATILVNNKRINSPFKIHAIGKNLNEDIIKNASVVLSLKLRGIDVQIVYFDSLQIPPLNYITFEE